MSRDELYTVETTASNQTGEFTRVTGTDVGNKRGLDVTTTSDFGFAISSGKIEGLTSRPIFGRNSDIDLANPFETIWNEGGVYSFPSSAATVDVVSTNINDTSAGTGAQSVIIEYLDASYVTNFETVALNGTTPVTTTNQMLRINGMAVLTAGASGGAVGVIRASQGSNVLARLDPVFNNTLQAVYTIPADTRGYFFAVSAQISIGNRAVGLKSGEFIITRNIAGDPALAAVIASLQTDGTGTFQLNLPIPLSFPATTDITAIFLAQHEDTTVSTSTTIVLEDVS